MHKFDVRYTNEHYKEYYKYALIQRTLVKNIICCVGFLLTGLLVMFYLKNDDGSTSWGLGIIIMVLALLIPLSNLMIYPIAMKKLAKQQADLARIHVEVTFDEEEIIYNNLTEPKPTAPVSEPIDVENEPKSDVEVVENEVTDVVEDDKPVEEKPSTNEETDENKFSLKYNNIMLVKELQNQYLFYLDRSTVIILPKDTYVGESNIGDFKEFILSKFQDPRRIKLLKNSK